jgi:hypothetical protein
MQLHSIEKKEQQIQVKLSAIFKQKAIDTPQAFGSFYESNGQKYCAISVLSKFLGYDIAAEKKIQNDNAANLAVLFPNAILEMIENFAAYGNPRENPKCFCSRPDYYYCGLISLLMHLNDYHRMTFTEIGNWLESKGI